MVGVSVTWKMLLVVFGLVLCLVVFVFSQNHLLGRRAFVWSGEAYFHTV
jgi:hypothetical protein